MKDTPLVSVIALCYNQANYAVETLNSVKAQTYENIQLIITDDASTDNSVEVIQQWITDNEINCTFIKNDENLGICKTLNKALEEVKGEYYQALACDDIILPDKIKTQVSLFKKLDDDYAVVYSDAYLMDNEGNSLYGQFIQKHRPELLKIPTGSIYQSLINKNHIPAPSVLVKTKIVREIGKYDDKLFYEDFDLWLRIATRYKFSFSKFISCKYRIHNISMVRSNNFSTNRNINLFMIYLKHRNNDIALLKLTKIINSLYRNNSHKRFKREILSVIDSKSMSYKFIKYNIDYKYFNLLRNIKNTILDN